MIYYQKQPKNLWQWLTNQEPEPKLINISVFEDILVLVKAHNLAESATIRHLIQAQIEILLKNEVFYKSKNNIQ